MDVSGQLFCRVRVRESTLGKAPEKTFQQSHNGNGNENWLELMRQGEGGEKGSSNLGRFIYAIYVCKVWMI